MATIARTSKQRPLPEVLLKPVWREESDACGLKIFVGIASFVCKTCAMFENARIKRKAGVVRPGSGLPTIIRRFIGATDGAIYAANRTDRSSAALTLRLPIPTASDALDTAA